MMESSAVVCYYGPDWFLNLIVVCLVFQCLQGICAWTHSWREVHVQQNQQRHNVLLRSVVGRLIVFCQRFPNLQYSWRYPVSVTHSCPPQKLPLVLFQSFLPSVALTGRHNHLLPAPIGCRPYFPPSSPVLFLARCPAWTRFQVQGPLPEPWYGRPCHSKWRDALPVASMGAQLRSGSSEAPGAASVLREVGAGPRYLHWGLHLHPDPRSHRQGTERTHSPGPEGDRTHLWQFSVWHPGAHGDRWVQVVCLRLRLCYWHLSASKYFTLQLTYWSMIEVGLHPAMNHCS